jgi:hypothetical protein
VLSANVAATVVFNRIVEIFIGLSSLLAISIRAKAWHLHDGSWNNLDS